MTNNPDNRSLDELEKRLKKAQKAQTDQYRPRKAPDRSFGMAYRLAVELVVAVVVGTLFGWYLDKWLGTAPFLVILFFFLGVAAGMMNVFRVAEIMRKESAERADKKNEE